ncbi:class I SAM-dependent methyltransferase [Paenibacillus hexagrammi]|uniref:Class I SAM-dependent methyltransferase n=1 Tax=Paenibacillus hexagrammi TaxID=2908839 RepID=A0ABY3SL55_9BACL|nr:class I SAM-dependent methyltransferase [Paenibacillus sp. YPD9-1]UJF34265.1 class I SAM-dependent methyltransferase [Paenibacillus sp. YPD9-1]
MGTSNWQNVSYCIDLIRRISPKVILDVGVGFGRWGVLCREFLDVWNGRVGRESWETRIEGIEAFSANIDEYHRFFYTKIWEMDASDFLRTSQDKYNLIIFGDVLEHFYKDEGHKLLAFALDSSDYVMINIPIGDSWEQGDVYGNQYEEHKSEWYVSDFDTYPTVRIRLFKDYICRDFATILMSRNNIIFNEFLQQLQIEGEVNQIKNELDYTQEYLNQLYIKKHESVQNLEIVINEGEMKISNAIKDEKSLITIKLSNDNNIKSNGNEVWIYHVSSDIVSAVDLNKIKKDSNWMTRADQNAPTGNCLIASQIGAEVQFEIIGKNLKLKCLSHPWSGKIEIFNGDAFLLKVDLYSANQKIIDVIINLKDVD